MKKYATCTVGLDIGDSRSQLCVLDAKGDELEQSTIPTTRRGIECGFAKRKPCLVVLEVGMHSPWISKQLEKYGHTVLIANARQLPLIYRSNDKDDRTDAEKLARIARLEPKLLKPLKHRSEHCQAIYSKIIARDALVRARTLLINCVRGTVKATGERLRSCSSTSFHKLKSEVPAIRREALDPVMSCIEALTVELRALEKSIENDAVERLPESVALMQVPGVGAITALAFVAGIEDPNRFKKNRDVGPYLGLRPRRAESGQQSPQLSITKAGNPYLRRLLVGSAQYILGPFAPEMDLRSWGLKLAGRGGKNAKKRAVVAVARKLSTVLLALWKSQAPYTPERSALKHGSMTKEVRAA